MVRISATTSISCWALNPTKNNKILEWVVTASAAAVADMVNDTRRTAPGAKVWVKT
jgi:hypothetical protein